ncbi:C-GCAxxG-C-C family protein [Clostridium sp. D2Q-14]|uniref:C-GCAxxG-C-C family (seleno)protein n=1 Tax=Anaeromonas gelatinilytica TaxID=2683194 RepID=UPI00193C4CD2|nr:C-GCAxxG-C-C family (seleno)protein [Anaeromonas gelatinilytica]MBS4535241.1 C-GCAxxG-C-C family protein [Anaeromonas gelatinilytica]
MIEEISIKKVKEDAEKLFRSGKFYCTEAVVSAIRDNFEIDMPKEMVAMASGFPVGIGKSKCVCGAVSGGVMMLGYFFGRNEGSNPKDPKSVNTLKLANELQDYFKKNHKVLCCKILTNGMDMGSGEHKNQCISFTGEIAEKTSEIIARELGIKNIDESVA